jgi:hypothetical protein
MWAQMLRICLGDAWAILKLKLLGAFRSLECPFWASGVPWVSRVSRALLYLQCAGSIPLGQICTVYYGWHINAGRLWHRWNQNSPLCIHKFSNGKVVTHWQVFSRFFICFVLLTKENFIILVPRNLPCNIEM